MKERKISIFASIWSQNLGDELILKNEINLLKKEFWENTKFFVFTYDKKDLFFKEKNVFYNFPIWFSKPWNIFRNIKNFFVLIFTIIFSDFIVIWWGGIIFDKENQSTRNPLDLWNFRTKLFRFFCKKIYFFRVWIDIKQEENLKKLLKEIKWEFKQDDKNPYDLKWFFEN